MCFFRTWISICCFFGLEMFFFCLLRRLRQETKRRKKSFLITFLIYLRKYFEMCKNSLCLKFPQPCLGDFRNEIKSYKIKEVNSDKRGRKLDSIECKIRQMMAFCWLRRIFENWIINSNLSSRCNYFSYLSDIAFHE